MRTEPLTGFTGGNMLEEKLKTVGLFSAIAIGVGEEASSFCRFPFRSWWLLGL